MVLHCSAVSCDLFIILPFLLPNACSHPAICLLGAAQVIKLKYGSPCSKVYSMQYVETAFRRQLEFLLIPGGSRSVLEGWELLQLVFKLQVAV